MQRNQFIEKILNLGFTEYETEMSPFTDIVRYRSPDKQRAVSFHRSRGRRIVARVNNSSDVFHDWKDALMFLTAVNNSA